MADKQPTPNIIVQYVTNEAPKRGWSLTVVGGCLLLAFLMCGQCVAWLR